MAPLWIGAAIIGIMFVAAGVGMLFIMRRLRKRLRTLSQRWWGSPEEDEKLLPQSKTDYHDEE